MRSWRRWVGASLLSLLAVGVTSCGGNAPVALPETGASMEGTVQYEGKTLGFGIVVVEGAGSSVQGNISRDGTYSVQNAPVGPVKLAVVTNPGMARGAQMAAGANQGPGAKGKGKLGKVAEYVDVPVKYHTTNTSNLSYTVEKGTNKYDIVIPK
jgi:hypothetical protein